MTTTQIPDRLLTTLLVDTREAARLLNISTRTLWTLTARGELPSVRIGRRVLYRVETLREFTQRQEGTGSD